MICLFGLYHGLVMLPVLLCLIGPVDIQQEDDSPDKSDKKEMLSLKFFRTLLSQKYFTNNKTSSNPSDIKEMETLKTNGNQDVREKLLEDKQEESQPSPGPLTWSLPIEMDVRIFILHLTVRYLFLYFYLE